VLCLLGPAFPTLFCPALPGPDATCHTVLCFVALSILNGPEAASTKQLDFAVLLSLTSQACETTCRRSQCKQSIYAVLSSLVAWHAGRSQSVRASIGQAQAFCSCPEAGRQAPYCPRAKCSCSQHGSRQLRVRLHVAILSIMPVVCFILYSRNATLCHCMVSSTGASHAWKLTYARMHADHQ